MGVGLGSPDGSTDGVLDGEADGLGDGLGHMFSVPCRKISCPPAHPCTMPCGCEYQSRILFGSALTK